MHVEETLILPKRLVLSHSWGGFDAYYVDHVQAAILCDFKNRKLALTEI